MNHQRIGLGVLFGLLAALFSTLMSLMVKIIDDQATIGMLVFFRFVISTFIMLPWVLIDKNFSWQLQRLGILTTRTIFALLALACLFYVVRKTYLANALVLSNTAPLFVPLMVYFIRGVKTSPKTLLGILLGFIGIIFILNPGSELFSPIIFVGLACGVFTSIAYVQIRQFAKANNPEDAAFFYFLMSTILSGFFLPFDWKQPSENVWYLILGMGIFGTIYQYCLTRAFFHAPVRLTSSLMFFSIVLGGILDWLIWDVVPSKVDLLGMILVILGGLIIILFGSKEVSKDLQRRFRKN